MVRRILLAASLALLSVPAAAEIAQVSVSVDFSKPGPAIDRHIYGQFAEHLHTGIYGGIWVGEKSMIANIKGYRSDVVAALKNIHVPVIRWPGGCFAEYYDWRDGIGPRNKRPRRNDTRGGVDDNAFGTHEFMDFAELLGADAYVGGNVGSLTPMEMTRWVEYITSDADTTLVKERRRNGRLKAWNLPFFGIGNETWGCGGRMRPDYAADLNARYSIFVNDMGPKNLITVASGGAGQGPDYEGFTEAFMKRPGELQALSFHYYAMPDSSPKGPATGFGEELWAQQLTLTLKMEPYLARISEIMDKHDPQKKVALYVDEWGSWYDVEKGAPPRSHYQQNTLRDAEVAALTLNIFHRHTDRVKLAAIAQMVNVLQAMILTDGSKMLLTPTYHVFDMYQPFMDAVPYPATVSGPDYRFGAHTFAMVDVSVAKGRDGKLYLSLTNTDPHNAAHVVTNIPGNAKGKILTGPAMDTHNSFAAPNTLKPVPFTASAQDGKLVVDLPAKSVVVVAVE
ncbi:MAG: alpha-L-arabinofuranosidase C-terminal domain-containing protein [Rhizomicrobium sp.]|nr:alpha-L-arabinofuranosidase C-terminal domain-containing protein [Rhizomicrobium sp.]